MNRISYPVGAATLKSNGHHVVLVSGDPEISYIDAGYESLAEARAHIPLLQADAERLIRLQREGHSQ